MSNCMWHQSTTTDTTSASQGTPLDCRNSSVNPEQNTFSFFRLDCFKLKESESSTEHWPPPPPKRWAIGAASILNIWSARSASNNAAFVPEPCSQKTYPWALRSLQGRQQVSCSKAAQQGRHPPWPTLASCSNCETSSGVGPDQEVL